MLTDFLWADSVKVSPFMLWRARCLCKALQSGMPRDVQLKGVATQSPLGQLSMRAQACTFRSRHG